MASEKDITYARAGGIDLNLDIYRPEGASKRAAILYFHGGGWRGGSREGMRNHARAMAEYGYVGLPTQYRLLGQSPFPAQIEDVKTAVRWTRAHAKDLDIDPDRIILWGSSAGAHLSLLAAATPIIRSVNSTATTKRARLRIAFSTSDQKKARKRARFGFSSARA